MNFQGNNPGTYFAFSMIAILSFFGNVLVLTVMVTKRDAFKKPYDIFMCNLAVTDILTSILLIFSRYLYLPQMPESSFAATLFCSTIWNACILFALGYVSIYTCFVLTIERWLAIVRPNTYRQIKARHAVYIVIFVWFWGLLIQTTSLFRAKPDFEKGTCKWVELSIGEGPFPYIEIILQCIIPFSTMVALYSHVLYKIKQMPHLLQGRSSTLKKRVTILVLAASCALIIGWLPSRISYMLSKLHLNDGNSLVHFSLVIVSFSSSLVNPFLYGLFSSEFRNDYKIIIRKILCMSKISDNTRTDTVNV